MIIFIAAHGQNRELGFKGRLPWVYGEQADDVRSLHSLANGKELLMGERTYRNYRNIQQSFQTHDVTVLSHSLNSLPDAKVEKNIKAIIERSMQEDIWVLGGGAVFAQLLPYAQKMYLTRIEAQFDADVFFPEYHLSEWRITKEDERSADDHNTFAYTFLELDRT